VVAAHQGASESWAGGLGELFRHVALFKVDRGRARLAAVRGLREDLVGVTVPLSDQTPLRWCLEAGSPFVSAGRAPGGAQLSRLLGVPPPRAYAVLPLVVAGKLVALAYVDNGERPFPVSAVGELFQYCAELLAGGEAAPDSGRAAPGPLPSSARRSRRRIARRPALITPPPPEPEESGIAVDELARRIAGEPLDDTDTTLTDAPVLPPPVVAPPPIVACAVVTPPPVVAPPPVVRIAAPPPPVAAPAVRARPAVVAPPPPPLPDPEEEAESALPAHTGEEVAPPAGELVVTPQGVVPASIFETRTKRRPRWRFGLTAAMAAAGMIGSLVPLAPVGSAEKPAERLAIPQSATVAEIADQLDERGLIRSPTAFQILARLTGSDRRMRAGAHTISSGAWAWTVLSELERSDVDMATVTIPEGLTLTEVAVLFEANGLGRSEAFIRVARDRELLERYGIAAESADGFLFPETYTFARGLPPREIVEIMLDQFFARFRDVPGGLDLGPEALVERVTLASIVQREARVEDEMPRIAGVFLNRLAQNMRLESCATVQYILGKPKARLRIGDLRIQSPYNTYLNEGLPPGPIANPGRAALAAALAPERHDYLFFVAREDGSGRHVFTKSFTAHQAVARRVQKD
jgi:UPF0755 protein